MGRPLDERFQRLRDLGSSLATRHRIQNETPSRPLASPFSRWISLAPDGRLLASAKNGDVRVWSLESQQVLQSFQIRAAR